MLKRCGLLRRAPALPYLAGVTLFMLAGCGFDATGQDDDSAVQAEYKAAFENVVRCVREKGGEASDLQPDSTGYGYQVVFGEGSQGLYDQCYDTYVEDVRPRWEESLALTGAEREAEYGRMIDCLEKAGVTGVKVGDPEEVVGAAIPLDNFDGIMCLQKSIYQLFPATQEE